jgi:hypothetical protein
MAARINLGTVVIASYLLSEAAVAAASIELPNALYRAHGVPSASSAFLICFQMLAFFGEMVRLSPK